MVYYTEHCREAMSINLYICDMLHTTLLWNFAESLYLAGAAILLEDMNAL